MSVELNINLPVDNPRQVDIVHNAIWSGRLEEYLLFGLDYEFDVRKIANAFAEEFKKLQEGTNASVESKPVAKSSKVAAAKQAESAKELVFIDTSAETKATAKPVAKPARPAAGILGKGGRMKRR